MTILEIIFRNPEGRVMVAHDTADEARNFIPYLLKMSRVQQVNEIEVNGTTIIQRYCPEKKP